VGIGEGANVLHLLFGRCDLDLDLLFGRCDLDLDLGRAC
jgi:hypothetical protein